MRLRKDIVAGFVISILAICNVVLVVRIWDKDRRQARMSEAVSRLNKCNIILENNSLCQFKYNDRQLSDFTVTDIYNVPHKLSSLCNGDEFKLVFKISHKNCTPCIDNELEQLYRISEKIGIDKIVVLCESENIREFVAYFRAMECPFTCFYIEENSFGDILKDENVPFIFLMNRELKLRNLFIPSRELPDYAGAYYRLMISRFGSSTNSAP